MKNLANNHKDNKVKKWANGLCDAWMKFKIETITNFPIDKKESKKSPKKESKKSPKKESSDDVVPETIPSLEELVVILKSAHKQVLDKPKRSEIKVALGMLVDNVNITVETLKATGLGKIVKRLSKHNDPKVSKWSGRLMQNFIDQFSPPVAEATASDAATKNATVVVPVVVPVVAPVVDAVVDAVVSGEAVAPEVVAEEVVAEEVVAEEVVAGEVVVVPVVAKSEFVPTEDKADDESTIVDEVVADDGGAEELDALKNEADMSIEELRAMYGQ